MDVVDLGAEKGDPSAVAKRAAQGEEIVRLQGRLRLCRRADSRMLQDLISRRARDMPQGG
jgi:dihydropteroate synthase